MLGWLAVEPARQVSRPRSGVRSGVLIISDEAADLGRHGVPAVITDCRRHLIQACRHWYPIVCDLHRFPSPWLGFTDYDDGHGGTAPYPLVWCAGSLPKRRRIVQAVRDYAGLPGPGALWSGGWLGWPETSVTADDVRVWLFSFGSVVKLVAFLGSLHWPTGIADLGCGGITVIELLILHGEMCWRKAGP